MNKPYYVLLTGGKNNAGDYLIKDRAFGLLQEYRKDREVVDFDGYRVLSDEQLDVVNNAQAVLLTGGPALNKNMYPDIYQLRDKLSDIKVPITTFGIGWHSTAGGWQDTHRYSLSDGSMDLLERIRSDGLAMSVRDYHTQNVLFNKGFSNVVMTGCPALYTRKSNEIRPASEIKKVAFSLGVAIKNSPKMYLQMQDMVLALIDYYGHEKVEVVFHHGLPKGESGPEGVTQRLNQAQIRFLSWLNLQGVSHVDISGSAENLISYYNEVDLHVGYRVHAHIFMSSLAKPSLLISEDGRGMALEKVVGGMILPGYNSVSENKVIERLHRIGIPVDSFDPVKGIAEDVINMLNYELDKGVRLQQVNNNIIVHKLKMIEFIKALP